MHTTQWAYRHENGEIEGFKGVRFTLKASKEDCINQVYRKCHMLGQKFNANNLIYSDEGLTLEELEKVRQDWNSNVRY